MRCFLCCTALLMVACQGTVSEGTASAGSAPGTSNGSKASGAGSSGRSGSPTGEGGTGGNTKPSRSQGAAGTTDSSEGGASGTSEETGGAGGDDTSAGTGGDDNTGGTGGSDPADMIFPDPMKDPDGFTALTKSDDTRVIYVSTSGSDSNDGLSEDKPLQTSAAGMKKLRDGFADWLLFKRGDTFMGGLGNFKGSGRSETEPMVISAYGEGARPVFRTGGSALNVINDSSGSSTHDHVWFIGLDFYSSRRDPADADFNGSPGESEGIRWRVGTKDLLIEDCVLRFYGVAMTFQDGDNLGISGVRLRRNQFLDSYNAGDTHSQGIYIFNTNGMLFEENIFDHNGWNETVSGAGKTIFNHNVYCDNKNTNIVLKNNIFLRASSHGVQLRPGGIADGNLFAYNAIGLLIGGGTNPNPGGVDGQANDNVVLLGTDIGSMPKQYGIELENIHAFDVGNNIVANSTTAMAASPLKMNISGVTYADNIVYNWPIGKNTGGSYPDPSRDLASYDATLGGPGTLEHFVEGLRSQSQQSWRTEYMAQTINAYIREGFAAN